MSRAVIYLDESGDLGWNFNHPYRAGGSSRHLTIAALIVPSDQRHFPKRLIRKLYTQFSWPTGRERKWAEMSASERARFAELATNLAQRPDRAITYHAITVRKENVQRHIRADGNKLYNYMIRLLLIKEMAKFAVVTFVPDQRSIKVASGNSLHDYLQTGLWFDEAVATQLTTAASESSGTLNIQFADMLSGAVQSHFEDRNSTAFTLLGASVKCSRLFFN